MAQSRPPISSSRVSTGDVARHSFAIVRRGFDTEEVRAYLQSVSRLIEEFDQREADLRAAVAEADERAAHPVVDEATLTASLGQHSAQILRHAHEEAARIVVQAQEGASTLLREAQSQVDEMQARTESAAAERVAEAELMVGNASSEARAEAEQILAEARGEGEEMITRAKDEGRALLEQVQEARRRVLADLATRRRTLSIQIEQLRAARDEMAASVQGVRATIDGILGELRQSDDGARAAALAAGDQARLHGVADGPYDEALSTGEIDVVAVAGAVAEAGADADPDRNAAAEGRGAGGAGAPSAEHTDEGPPPSVDELFARIRAGSDEPGGETAVEEPSGNVIVIVDGEGTAGAEAEAGAEVEAEKPAGPDDPLIARRDELMGPVAAQLNRHIKRALGDDQNRMLHVLRSAPATQGDALLGPEDAHMDTFTSAAYGHLADAFSAGVEFAGGSPDTVTSTDAVEQSSAALARTIVTMLRRSIEDGAQFGDEASERVGAAFRQWRGERIERLVGDFAVQAFSAGVAAASPPDGLVRWVLTSSDGCSDCDDNALAGGVPVTEGFPTGHPYPPAHSGCRCLVTPAPA
jgi:DivIVA domain-containing protein